MGPLFERHKPAASFLQQQFQTSCTHMLCMKMWQSSHVLLDTLHGLLSINQVAACMQHMHLTASSANNSLSLQLVAGADQAA